MSMSLRYAMAAALLLAGCAPEPAAQPASENGATESHFQTDATSYTMARDEQGWGTVIRYRFRNPAQDTLYAVNCNGVIAPGVEERDSAGWQTMWSPITNQCLSPPIVIAPGAERADSVVLWGARPGANTAPEFTDTTFAGVYRLVLYNVVRHYDPDRPGFGDSVPVLQRVSNEFRLRR